MKLRDQLGALSSSDPSGTLRLCRPALLSSPPGPAASASRRNRRTPAKWRKTATYRRFERVVISEGAD
jgi:hypothetical protein